MSRSGTLAIPADWTALLEQSQLGVRLTVLAELARAGVIESLGLDVEQVFRFAVELDHPGLWDAFVKPRGPDSTGAWARWSDLCASASATSDVADYRDLLDERYPR